MGCPQKVSRELQKTKEKKIFGAVEKIIENVSAKMEKQHKENYSYLGKK